MVPRTEIEEHLRRILLSTPFAASVRSKQFLEFCVQQTLCGNSTQLKETTIGVEIFQRAADYDPKADPIVRVHARRVRDKLKEYYSNSGSQEVLHIDLPKGSYIPIFERVLPQRKSDFSDWREAEMIDPLTLDADPPRPRPNARRFFTLLRNRIWPLTACALFLMLLPLASLYWASRSRAAVRPLAYGVLKPLETGFHSVYEPSWSPDGTHLLFTASTAENRTPYIYVQTVYGNTLPTRLLHGTDAEYRPVWSPNGREVAYIRTHDPQHFEIVRVQLNTGREQSLGLFPSNWFLEHLHYSLDWSPDGNYLLTSVPSPSGVPFELMLFDLRNGERRILTTPPSRSTGDLEGRFSPDSQWIAFHRGGVGELYVVSVQGEQARPASRITFDGIGVHGIAWCDHGQSVLFSSRREASGAYGLWKIPFHGGEPEKIGASDFDVVDPALSVQNQIVLRHREEISNLLEYPAYSSATPRPIAPSAQVDAFPAYSADGHWVAFTSTRSGASELWLYSMDNKPLRQLTHFNAPGLFFTLNWSPDSKEIAFSYRRGSATNLYRYNMETGSITALTDSHNRNISPVYSADGRYIYFSSNDDGNARIWRIRTDGSGHAEPLFMEAIVGFLPSFDGQSIYQVEASKKATITRRNLQDGTTEEIFHASGRPATLNSIVASQGMIYFAICDSTAGEATVYRIDPVRKTSTIATHLHNLPPAEEASFTVSPDGNHILAPQAIRRESGLYLLDMK